MTASRIHDPVIERAAPDEMRAMQTSRVLGAVQSAYATNHFYRELWDASGVDVSKVNSLDAMRRLPMVDKQDFVNDQRDHPPYGKRLQHAVSLGERLELYTTSGTSGQGVEVHAQTERELAAMIAMYRFMFRWAGLSIGDLVLLTLPITMMAGGRVEWQGATGSGMTVLPAGSVDAKAKLDLIHRFKPKALYGSTSYFGHLLALSEGRAADSSVEVLLTGLEGAGFSYLEQLAAGWGASVADRFGCTQLRADCMFTCENGVGTAERPGLLHNLDPFVFLEVIDPATGDPVEDGEFGEMVVTSLYHVDNPVIRCRLHDGGVWHRAEYCSCGRPFAGVAVASIGRTDDVKKVKGVIVYPQAVDDVMFSFGEVDEYRVTLTSDESMADRVAVEVMTKSRVGDEFRTAVAEALRLKIGLHCSVECVAELPRSEYKARRWIDERAR
jgi:phenylacetate-CoA ligase